MGAGVLRLERPWWRISLPFAIFIWVLLLQVQFFAVRFRNTRAACFVIWSIVVGVLLVGDWRERRAGRRASKGLCPRCAYDLRGDLDSGCPECGWNRSDSNVQH